MYISRPSEFPYTIADIAKDLHVSQNHLVKVVHFMGKQEWIITTRGKGGGLRLNPKALEIRLGHIVRILQGDHQIVECHEPPCVMRAHCGLKGILDQALEQFYVSLDQHTLRDVLNAPPTYSPIAFVAL